MKDSFVPAVVSRRGLLSFLGITALVVAAPTLLTQSDAQAQPAPTGTERRQDRRTDRVERRQERRTERTERRAERRARRKARRAARREGRQERRTIRREEREERRDIR